MNSNTFTATYGQIEAGDILADGSVVAAVGSTGKGDITIRTEDGRLMTAPYSRRIDVAQG